MVKFDGTNWTVYNTSNSKLPYNNIYSIAIHAGENIWIGTNHGLAKFDGINWTVYNSSNSGLPKNWIDVITIDKNGNKWIGTTAGLVKFDDTKPDGTGWTVYNQLPSGPNSIAIDANGDKWLGTDGFGLIVFNESGLIFNVSNYKEYNKDTTPKQISLMQNYPNPFNPYTTIKYQIPAYINPTLGGIPQHVTLKVYDILGKEIATLVNEEKPAGNYSVNFNGSNLPSGVYIYRIQAGSFTQSRKFVLLK